MRRALVVAGVEFRALTRTRSFLLGLLLPPVIALLGGLTATLARPPEDRPPPPPLRIAVVDHTGSLFPALELAAARHNESAKSAAQRIELERIASPGEASTDAGGTDAAPDLLAEIPADAAAASAEPVRLRLVGRDVARGAVTDWLQRSLQEELRTRALRSPGVSAELRARLERRVLTEFEASAPAPGEARAVAPDPDSAHPALRARIDRLGAYRRSVVAWPLAVILFFAVGLAVLPLFQATLEEKTSRVGEILLSSASPLQLMLGKLLGSLGACGIAAVLYAGVLFALLILTLGEAVPLGLLLLFGAYLVLAVLLWGSIYLTIGAACADLKDSQNLMVPATLLQLLPVMVIGPVIEQPSGTLARVLSLLPFSAPQMMLLRLGYDPAPPVLEIALSLALLALTALAAVAVAARVLRVGLLAHGRTASLREIVRWVRSG